MTEQADERSWVLRALDRFEGPLITYTARLLGRDVERARDVVQDAFLKLCSQDQRELEPRVAEWLFKVCRNAALDVRRKERRMESINMITPGACSEPGPASRAEFEDDVSRVAQAIAGLPANQQEVLQLRFQHGLTYRELSEVTGRTVSHVGVLIHNGIKALRAQLGGDFGSGMSGGSYREGVTR